MERESIQKITKQSIEILKKIKGDGGKIKNKSGKCFCKEKKTINYLLNNLKKNYNKVINTEITKIEMAKFLVVVRANAYRCIKIYENNK